MSDQQMIMIKFMYVMNTVFTFLIIIKYSHKYSCSFLY